jgi:PAS domain S-box-containing protein
MIRAKMACRPVDAMGVIGASRPSQLGKASKWSPHFSSRRIGCSVSDQEALALTLLSNTVLESVPDAVAAVNQQGVVVQINSQLEMLFGYTRDELIGQKIEILVPERQRPQHHKHRENFHQQPKIRRMGSGLDLYGRRRDGSEFPVEISLSPITPGNDTIVLSAIRDINDRKRIEEDLRRAKEELDQRKTRELRDSQNRLALIVDSSQDAIIGKNLNGIVTHWNRGAQDMYGYTAQDMIGRPISTLAPPERGDEILEILQKIRNGDRVEYFESVRVTKDQEEVECLDFGFANSRFGRQNYWGVNHCSQYHCAEEGRGSAAGVAEDGSSWQVGWRRSP